MPNFNIEKGIIAQHGYYAIAGIDEVGRGSLAGPLVAAAVVFDKYDHIISYLTGVNDSKKLTPKKRQELSEVIKSTAREISIGAASVEEIDKIITLWSAKLPQSTA